MKRAQHLFLEIPQEVFQNRILRETIEKRLRLPDKIFPPSFHIKKRNFFCAGYFVCYDRKFSAQEVVDACRKGNWELLASLVADFLIIHFDFSKNRLFVLTDQTGKFPCYFSVSDGRLLLSTDFATVKDGLSSLNLNLSAALDYLADNQFGVVGDETIVSEIRKVPPGTLLMVENNLSYSLRSLVDLEDFLAQGQTPYDSVEDFTDGFLALFKKLVAQRLEVLGSLPFAADLSSGFDSSLVCYFLKQLSRKPFTCYAMTSRYTTEDTSPAVIKEFASKHNLSVEFVNVDEHYPFAKERDLQLNAKYPIDAMYDAYLHFLLERARGGNIAAFGGDGGDEVYLAFKMDELVSFPIQNEYFLTLERLQKYHLGEIMTKRAITMLLDRDRFAKKRSYPVLFPPSIVTGALLLFPLHWEAGVWPVTPFTDPRLVCFARRIPHQGMKAPDRGAIWKGQDEIFVSSQFRPKIGPDKFIKLFLTQKADFIISVLKESILAQRGWVNSPEIAKDVQKGDVNKYSGDALVYLHNLIRLEYFLQHNNVKVSD